MVRPVDFAFNEQTATDNEFQHNPEQQNVNELALNEFEKAVQLLTQAGVKVLVLGKNIEPHAAKTPDAVFPNNWISTESTGAVVIYPMYAPNRRAEALRWPDVENLFAKNNLSVNGLLYLGGTNTSRPILEGTGSMVIDRINKVVYASRSIRTEEVQVNNFVKMLGYEKAVVFDAISSTGKEFYHTNVVMSIGDKFAVICAEAIPEKERASVLTELAKHREVIDISLEQTEKSFCGNIIQLATNNGGSVVVMSESALNGFSAEQKQQMEKYGKLLALPIPTIEYVGGGSARCMIAEVFLPQK
ncbi:hypothetical protein SAMN05421780_11537 [Flexibacter flexilis DSM 6793]|uniref:Amidinotransferase n=2 Tax=Flexibacter flexilis TaxID=998 RepID=A0A1I1NIV3_9BACT|nr:hypothetical protein SAMN05421780_11537 [Flexibacter flexilis DSM 6793]